MQKPGWGIAFESLFFFIFNAEIFLISIYIKDAFAHYGFDDNHAGIFFYCQVVVLTLLSSVFIGIGLFSNKSTLKETGSISILNFLGLTGVGIASIPFKLC